VSFTVSTTDQKWLRKRKLEIATPMYGAQCTGQHRALCLSLTHLLTKFGVTHKFSGQMDESLITRGRNKIACHFLQSDYTDLLFLDADIWLKAEDVLHMLLISKKHRGIVCAPYAKKGINWARIAKVCQQKKEYPLELMNTYGGSVVANFIVPNMSWRKPIKVLESGTGIMLIPRYVFTKMISRKAIQWYKFVDEELPQMKTRKAFAFFMDPIDPKDHIHLSEDWYFARTWKRIGGTTWLCPWIVSKHIGQYEYELNIPAIAQTGETL
jgi:hypothetical protein